MSQNYLTSQLPEAAMPVGANKSLGKIKDLGNEMSMGSRGWDALTYSWEFKRVCTCLGNAWDSPNSCSSG